MQRYLAPSQQITYMSDFCAHGQPQPVSRQPRPTSPGQPRLTSPGQPPPPRYPEAQKGPARSPPGPQQPIATRFRSLTHHLINKQRFACSAKPLRPARYAASSTLRQLFRKARQRLYRMSANHFIAGLMGTLYARATHVLDCLCCIKLADQACKAFLVQALIDISSSSLFHTPGVSVHAYHELNLAVSPSSRRMAEVTLTASIRALQRSSTHKSNQAAQVLHQRVCCEAVISLAQRWTLLMVSARSVAYIHWLVGII